MRLRMCRACASVHFGGIATPAETERTLEMTLQNQPGVTVARILLCEKHAAEWDRGDIAPSEIVWRPYLGG